ncbi:hypothetical protein HYT01_01670 [Candidatus Giovannonibacteria bacterium]|nr:hypothetical protein [Candidatus Giovannonibacteria bacterium]
MTDRKKINNISRTLALLILFSVFLWNVNLVSPANAQTPPSGTAYSDSLLTEQGDVGGYIAKGFLWGLNGILTSVLFFEARLVEMAGLFFDVAIEANLKPISRVDAIVVGWNISRSVANIFFIIVLLVIAIATILRLQSYQAKALLPKLIVIALLINFSLSIGYFLIDFSNVMGLGFYNQLVAKGSISNNLMAGTALSNVFNIRSDTGGSISQSLTAWLTSGTITGGVVGSTVPVVGTLIGGISGAVVGAIGWTLFGGGVKFADAAIYFYTVSMSVIYVIPLIFVFIFGGILLFIRFAVLTLLLILAPLAFIGYILPDTEGKLWKTWWDSFLNHAFFFPAMLFMLYISILIVNWVNAQQWAAAPQKNVAFFTNLFVVIIFLIGSLIVSKKMGVAGAGTVLGWATKSKKYLTGYAGGLAKRNLIARPAAAIQDKYGDRLEAGAATSRTTRLALRGIQTAQKAGGYQDKVKRDLDFIRTMAAKNQGSALLKMQKEEPRKFKMAMEEVFKPRDLAEIYEKAEGKDQKDIRRMLDDEATTNLMTPENRDKYFESRVKVEMKDMNQYAKNFLEQSGNMQKVGLETMKKEDIQKMANVYSDDADKEKFVTAIKNAKPEKINDALSVLPRMADKAGKTIGETVEKIDFEKGKEENLTDPLVMAEIVKRAAPKNIGKIIERNDEVSKEYLKGLHGMFVTAGNDYNKLAEKFESENNIAMANKIKGSKQFRESLGLENPPPSGDAEAGTSKGPSGKTPGGGTPPSGGAPSGSGPATAPPPPGFTKSPTLGSTIVVPSTGFGGGPKTLGTSGKTPTPQTPPPATPPPATPPPSTPPPAPPASPSSAYIRGGAPTAEEERKYKEAETKPKTKIENQPADNPPAAPASNSTPLEIKKLRQAVTELGENIEKIPKNTSNIGLYQNNKETAAPSPIKIIGENLDKAEAEKLRKTINEAQKKNEIEKNNKQ